MRSVIGHWRMRWAQLSVREQDMLMLGATSALIAVTALLIVVEIIVAFLWVFRAGL